jgi:hypothetical protein
MPRVRPARRHTPTKGFLSWLSAPLLLVMAAVVLIGLATELSTFGVHDSLPRSVDLPGIASAHTLRAGGPDSAGTLESSAPADGSDPSSASAKPTTAENAMGGPLLAPTPDAITGVGPVTGPTVTPVNPDYPVGGQAAAVQYPATESTGALETATSLPFESVPPTATPRRTNPSSTTTTTESSDDGTQTVPPYYPVLTTPSGPTSTVSSASSPTTTDH